MDVHISCSPRHTALRYYPNPKLCSYADDSRDFHPGSRFALLALLCARGFFGLCGIKRTEESRVEPSVGKINEHPAKLL
jgi:hypothetical protein